MLHLATVRLSAMETLIPFTKKQHIIIIYDCICHLFCIIEFTTTERFQTISQVKKQRFYEIITLLTCTVSIRLLFHASPPSFQFRQRVIEVSVKRPWYSFFFWRGWWGGGGGVGGVKLNLAPMMITGSEGSCLKF